MTPQELGYQWWLLNYVLVDSPRRKRADKLTKSDIEDAYTSGYSHGVDDLIEKLGAKLKDMLYD